MFGNWMTKRKASLFAASGLVALLLILETKRPNFMSAEPPGPAQGVRMFNGTWPITSESSEAARYREDDIVRHNERRAIESLRKTMACPQEIPVPDGIPTYKEAGAGFVFPKHGFEARYLEGWNECLFVIGVKSGDIHCEMTSCAQSFNNIFEQGAGLVAGFHDCQKRIIALADIYNVELIRRMAKELHREIPDGVAWRRK
jgi:hypothetical protein